MLNIQVVNTLKKQGFEISEIMNAIRAAEKDGEAILNGWTIRYNDRGENRRYPSREGRRG